MFREIENFLTDQIHRPVGNAYMRSLQGISGAPVNGISQTQLASACLREAASAKAGAFLSGLREDYLLSNLREALVGI